MKFMHVSLLALLLVVVALFFIVSKLNAGDAGRAQKYVGADQPGRFQGYLAGSPHFGDAVRYDRSTQTNKNTVTKVDNCA